MRVSTSFYVINLPIIESQEKGWVSGRLVFTVAVDQALLWHNLTRKVMSDMLSLVGTLQTGPGEDKAEDEGKYESTPLLEHPSSFLRAL